MLGPDVLNGSVTSVAAWCSPSREILLSRQDYNRWARHCGRPTSPTTTSSQPERVYFSLQNSFGRRFHLQESRSNLPRWGWRCSGAGCSRR